LQGDHTPSNWRSACLTMKTQLFVAAAIASTAGAFSVSVRR